MLLTEVDDNSNTTRMASAIPFKIDVSPSCGRLACLSVHEKHITRNNVLCSRFFSDKLVRQTPSQRRSSGRIKSKYFIEEIG